MLELFDESVAPHYMMGRKPGMFPSFSDAYAEGEGYPHPVPFDLFDPFGSLRKRMDTEEKRARGRLIEINNGRAAMMGIIGMMIHESLTGNPVVAVPNGFTERGTPTGIAFVGSPYCCLLYTSDAADE